MLFTIGVIVVSLLSCSFFLGMEAAYLSANKIHVEIEKKQGGLMAKVLTRLTLKPSKFIATMLVGYYLSLVVYSIYSAELITGYFYPEFEQFSDLPIQHLLFIALCSGLVLAVLAKLLPKIIFQIYANTLLKALAIPVFICYSLLKYITSFIMWISKLISRVFFKINNGELQYAFSKVELGDYISEQMDAVDHDQELDSEIQLFQNALEFSEVKAREVMVPRTEITAVELHESPKGLSSLFTNSGYSKILVYKDTIDDIVGYVHSFDLFKKPKGIKSIMMPVEFVPETMLISDVLEVLTKKHKSIAVVLDEYGGTSGIMTVEDIVEELFGEIEDEHDTVELLEEKISDNEYRFSARLEVDYVNEIYKLGLPDSEHYETLGGMILSQLGEIPEKGAVVEFDGYEYTILEVSTTKIEIIHLKVLDQ
ncbi:hemolysin family protein [Galbibacter sp.]|uniref:hemolysin family protein n=1 Tax=Galbibacter sp. TaxID=2918471 RepID=UPI003A91A265